MAEQEKSKVWYKEPWPWILMAGPAIVVVAAFTTYYLAATHNSDMVTDEYYKEGKHIGVELQRDQEAAKRKIDVQVLINPEHNAAKVLISGNFDPKQQMDLQLLHPAHKSEDQTVKLFPEQGGSSGDKASYHAVFKTLPATNHWYVRVEDTAGKWRVEDTWVVSQGDAIHLTPGNNSSNSAIKPITVEKKG